MSTFEQDMVHSRVGRTLRRLLPVARVFPQDAFTQKHMKMYVENLEYPRENIYPYSL